MNHLTWLSFFIPFLTLLSWVAATIIDSSLTTQNNNKPKGQQRYEPTWESLESRPLPVWFDQSKLGIFIHWGVYAVPGFGNEWFWWNWIGGMSEYKEFMRQNYPPQFTYQGFGPLFTAEFYDPIKWAELFQKSGAKYVVLTSKHHEGYAMWPSKYSFGWNSGDVGPKRDLLGDLATAVRAKNLRFGIYHSLYEWFNPLFRSDQQNFYQTDEFIRAKVTPSLHELVNEYQPDIVWSDGEWSATEDYWKSKEFIAWLYNDSPVNATVVTNDRWGKDTKCKHGGYFTCSDRYNPGVLLPYKWENCIPLDKISFGYRRNAKLEDFMSPKELVQTLIETVSCGGNLLVNIGPTKEGTIVPIQEERLLQLGQWLGINGQAIYESMPWTTQNDTGTLGVWYTTNPTRKQVYAMVLDWPGQEPLYLGSVDPATVQSVGLLGYETELTWRPGNLEAGIFVNFPTLDQVKSEWAWTVVIGQKDEAIL